MDRTDVFHRTDLAARLAGQLMSSDGASGLFITAPRRTGKTTFIREDLVPALRRGRRSHVVYVDLWEDREANPGDVIVGAIRSELLAFEGLITRAAKGVGPDRIKVGGLEMNLDRIGFGTGETLTKALTVLAAAAKKPVTLIIDEAQHAQTTDAGKQALYALKAARDALNASTGPGFRLLATGSSADKLTTLVDDKDQAFYQAPLLPLPTLGDDYLQWFRDRQRFEPLPSLAALRRAFDACSHRPEPLRAIVRALSLHTGIGARSIDAHFASLVAESLARTRNAFLQQLNGLQPLDAAVLAVMAEAGAAFAPYTKASFARYRALIADATGEPADGVNQSAVQQALERLRIDQFVWRAGRGAYLIEDPQHIAWIREQRRA